MSTSLLYHAFGVRGYQYQRTEYAGGAVTFVITQPRESYACAVCGSGDVIGKGKQERTFRTVPVGAKPVYLALAVPRVECRECGAVRQVRIGFADPRVSYTRVFERYALELSKCMTIKDVAQHLGISWDVIKEIQKRHLKRRFGKPKLRHLKQIAIDEISTGKGHHYVTIVMDLESGAVVHVGEGKGGEALKPFWKRLRGSGAKIEAGGHEILFHRRRAVRESPFHANPGLRTGAPAVLRADQRHRAAAESHGQDHPAQGEAQPAGFPREP